MPKYTLPLIAALAAAALTVSTARAADIVVATAGPMTGGDAAFGEQMKRGAEAAVADINAAGGVLGNQLKLEIGDDECDPNKARSVAEDLVSRGVVFVAGHYCSSASIPASEVYGEANVLQITPASTNPKLTDEAAAKGWTHVFRTCGRDDVQGTVAGNFLATKYAGKKVAIVHDKTTYGKGIADETQKAMNAAGLTETMYEAINKGDKDFSALVSKLKEGSVDAVYLGLYHTEAGLVIKQAREQGLQSQFVSEDAIVNKEFWEHRRRCGGRHDQHLRSRSAEIRHRQGSGRQVQGPGIRPRGLYTLHLCRFSGVGRGREAGRRDRCQEGGGSHAQEYL